MIPAYIVQTVKVLIFPQMWCLLYASLINICNIWLISASWNSLYINWWSVSHTFVFYRGSTRLKAQGTFGGIFSTGFGHQGLSEWQNSEKHAKKCFRVIFHGESRIILFLVQTLYIWNVNSTFSVQNRHILRFLVAMETIPIFLNGTILS